MIRDAIAKLVPLDIVVLVTELASPKDIVLPRGWLGGGPGRRGSHDLAVLATFLEQLHYHSLQIFIGHSLDQTLDLILQCHLSRPLRSRRSDSLLTS